MAKDKRSKSTTQSKSSSLSSIVDQELRRQLLAERGDLEFRKRLVSRILERQASDLTNLLCESISNKQSNAVLVCGDPGSGKSIVIDVAIAKLKESYQHVAVFWLTSDHTTDEMTVQDLECQIEEQIGCNVAAAIGGASADGENDEDELDGDPTVIANDRFGRIISFLTASQRKHSLIFVIDPLDSFVNRRLLYTLVDSIYSPDRLPVCVVATSCSQSVSEKLEKRVQSRFSGRQINVSHSISNAESVLKAIEFFLETPVSKSDIEASEWASKVLKLLANSQLRDKSIDSFLSNKPSLRDLKMVLAIMIFLQSDAGAKTPLTLASFDLAVQTYFNRPNAYLKTLVALPPLELNLLACFDVAVAINRDTPISKETGYGIYQEFIKRNYDLRSVCDAATALRALERLADVGLLRCRSGGSGVVATYSCGLSHADLLKLVMADKLPACTPHLVEFLQAHLGPIVGLK